MLDERTIQDARAGRRDAQASVLRALQDVWFRFAMGLLGRTDDALDAAQETGLRVLKSIQTFDGRSSLKTWSIGIALNVVRETRRKRGPVLSGYESAEPDKFQESADTSVSRTEDIMRLRQFLGELPERQREAVVLRYFEGLSVEEAAAQMGVAEGTVKASVFQAIASLRERFGPKN